MNKKTIHNHIVKDIAGNDLSLETFKNKVLLVVNTASYCGFTNQYKGLQNLYEKFKNKGFSVLAFPCNQFASQEPGSEKEILDFCTTNFNVSFPMFSKVKVNGRNADALFKFLKSEKTGSLGSKRIKWNFTKFLINKEGEVIKRFGPKVKPKAIESDIIKLL